VGLARALRDPGCFERQSCAAFGPAGSGTMLLWQGAGMSRRCEEYPKLKDVVPRKYASDVAFGMTHGGFGDCEPWPGGKKADSGADVGVRQRLGLPGRAKRVRDLMKAGRLPPYVAPDLRDQVPHLMRRDPDGE
jgi:hypothetical protein